MIRPIVRLGWLCQRNETGKKDPRKIYFFFYPGLKCYSLTWRRRRMKPTQEKCLQFFSLFRCKIGEYNKLIWTAFNEIGSCCFQRKFFFSPKELALTLSGSCVLVKRKPKSIFCTEDESSCFMICMWNRTKQQTLKLTNLPCKHSTHTTSNNFNRTDLIEPNLNLFYFSLRLCRRWQFIW